MDGLPKLTLMIPTLGIFSWTPWRWRFDCFSESDETTRHYWNTWGGFERDEAMSFKKVVHFRVAMYRMGQQTTYCLRYVYFTYYLKRHEKS